MLAAPGVNALPLKSAGSAAFPLMFANSAGSKAYGPCRAPGLMTSAAYHSPVTRSRKTESGSKPVTGKSEKPNCWPKANSFPGVLSFSPNTDRIHDPAPGKDIQSAIVVGVQVVAAIPGKS